jgi:hypothetical protein
VSTLIKNAEICWHSDPDEAFLVGTEESLRKLAHDILNLLEQEKRHESEIGSVRVQFTSSGNPLTESGMDIILDGLAIVESNNDVFKVVNELRVLNGMLPFAEE